MSFQDSSLTPTMDDIIDINMLLGEIEKEDTMDGGNIKIGEIIDLELPVPTENTTQNTTTENNTTTQNATTTDGSTPLGDQYESSQS
ncbi:unnamed protein product [Vicia faba]|uniref:Uncharacterized protein n=1 Tax=Vicia faba TaxID=3906 RepID=A0AAV0Z1P3_VICFA|nr:unnamed protein product [Vicia faba]